ncbi:MAG: aspartate-semialdehyde dehydrogenase [Gammaproteobacteria bacterium]|nr:aspartate-semialdehyde dehydrogenase [Gammaproteobacteria bacterium]
MPKPPKTGLRVVVAGASGLVGEATLEALGDADLPVASVEALASDKSVGKNVQFGSRSLPIGVLADFDFTEADLALFAVDADVAGVHIPRALAAGCRVIDASVRYHDEPGVPLCLPSAGTLPDEVRAARLASLPVPAAAALARVLAPLAAAAGLVRVDVTVLEPVSVVGRAGVDELAAQTALLMNGRPASKARLFGKQTAFNVLPESGGGFDGGAHEQTVVEQVRRLLGQPDLPIGISVVTVPVFFGCSIAVQVELAREFDADAARALFARAAGVRVVDQAKVRYPTAAVEAVESGDVLVGRIRTDSSRERGIALWVVADNVRTLAANLLASATQILVKGSQVRYSSKEIMDL